MTVRNFFGEARQEAMQIGKAEGIQIGKAEGIQIGEARGIQIGRLDTLVSLVADGLLPLSAAAKKAGMTEEAFKARMLEHETSKDS